ncbi:ABC transporter permease [Pseudaminobacter salicylatoxidans]|uniref:ABC transporter permease n=1 Tax=Pseudaminobacter salicylatoxidans TaxID=93369 RepID=UPI0012F6D057|nr:ABC transporter permease [Pseudaminobacter salicylatoxidans]
MENTLAWLSSMTPIGLRVSRPFLTVCVSLGLLLCFGFLNPVIISVGNIENILVQASYLAIFASAQAVVILVRGLDLSLGTTVSLVSVSTALLMTATGLPAVAAVPVGILLGLGVGAMVGLANGLGVAIGQINPFIMTLGTLYILMSIATTISGGFPVQTLPDGFLHLARIEVFSVPLQIVVAIGVLGFLQWVLLRTYFGRALYLVGSNPSAARVAGIPVNRVQCFAFMICSVLAALGALLLTARTGSGEPTLVGTSRSAPSPRRSWAERA